MNSNVRRIKRRRATTTFYGPKDTRFNVAFNRPPFEGPGIDLCGPHVSFGATKRQQELDLWGNEEDISKIRAMNQEKGMARVRKK